MAYTYFKHIASVVAHSQGNLLLVQQQNPEEALASWGLPGGQVEPGEDLIAGLQRELHEETGLYLKETPTIAFVVQVFHETNKDIEESLAFHFACKVEGHISPQDPDGLVFSAHWIQTQIALEHLSKLSWYDSEPLRRWLNGLAAPGTIYTVRVKE